MEQQELIYELRIYELLKSHKRHLKKLVVNSTVSEFIYLETNLSFILIHFVVIDLVGKLNFGFKRFDTFFILFCLYSFYLKFNYSEDITWRKPRSIYFKNGNALLSVLLS